MSALAKIHAMRREVVGLDDDESWRDVLERVTGGRSAKGLSGQQADAVIAELRRLGARGAPARAASGRPSKGPLKGLSGPYALKLRALWIACWNLGLVDDVSDAALHAFARRQTGLASASWVRHQEHAVAVIEALKAMCARAGVDWGPLGRGAPDWQGAPGARVARAQWRMLGGIAEEPDLGFSEWVQMETKRPVDALDRAGWIAVMTLLGERLRRRAAARGGP